MTSRIMRLSVPFGVVAVATIGVPGVATATIRIGPVTGLTSAVSKPTDYQIDSSWSAAEGANRYDVKLSHGSTVLAKN